MELRNPEYALDSFMERKRQCVVGLFDGVAALNSAIEKQRTLLKEHLESLQVVERRIQAAKARRDMVDGPRLLAERDRLQKSVAATRELLRSQEREQQEMTERLHDAKLELEHTETERVSLCAQLKYQRAQEVATRALDNVLRAPEDRIMERMRDKVQEGRARFQLASELHRGPGAQGFGSLSAAYADEFTALCDEADADSEPRSSQLAMGMD